MTVTVPRRAFLGAELPDDHEAFGAGGVRIAGVAADGMAERAGLVAGDVMVSLADQPVRDLRELSAALRCAGALAATDIVFVHDGSERTARADVVRYPREQAVYGAVAVAGATLRTIATEPPAARGRIVMVQGIACESIDAPDAPLAHLAAAWTRRGFATLRFDKRGCGDSDGEPGDFATELDDARRVLATVHDRPLVLFGHSVGGVIASQLASAADAVIVYGTPVMRWIDCLLDSTRRQLALRGAPEAEILRRLASIRDLARSGELNGRSAAYHAQLDALDHEAAWRAVTAPVLVLRGEYDWVVAADDQARIAQLAPRTRICDVPRVDHLLGAHADRVASLRDYGSGTLDESVAELTQAWLHELGSSS